MKIVYAKEKSEFHKKHIIFYEEYASFVHRTLRNPLYQKFLNWVLRKEKIQKSDVKEVQIRTFPFKKKNGKSVAGKCKSNGEILLYPKRLKICLRILRKFGMKKLYFYIRCRARAALLHEVLHLKYEKNEKKVRELTKKYVALFNRNKQIQKSEVKDVVKLIFK